MKYSSFVNRMSLSVATIFAASGARAADAVVVAEPEPMDYVRVCDTYGGGFYYIPGTETCLKVSGYMRYDIGVGDLFGLESYDKKEYAETGIVDENNTYYKRARFQLRVDARSETELGTLRAYLAMNAQFDTNEYVDQVGRYDSTADEFYVEKAFIELGGLFIGKTDSLYSRFTNFAGGVIHDDIIHYGPNEVNQIVYTYKGGNGFKAAIGVEEGYGKNFTIDDYVPDMVAGVSFTQGWGGVSAVVGYDAVWENWAGKIRLDVDFSDNFEAFLMAGYDGDEDLPNFYAPWGGSWAVWGGFTAGVTDKAAINVQLTYDDWEQFAAVANVEYELVPGLKITPEVGYYDYGKYDDGDAFGAFVRFQRNFE
jgi:hypothetical protein